MILLVGASASGKSEIAKILIKKYNIKKCVTTTTRNLREGEISGVDYHFLSKAEFLKMVDEKKFVENAIYNNNFYGIFKSEIKNESLIIVEPNGANKLIEIYGDLIFLVYIESLVKTRKKRMLKRGDLKSDINMRIFNDSQVFKKENLSKIDLHIFNNNNNNLEEIAYLIKLKYDEFLSKQKKETT